MAQKRFIDVGLFDDEWFFDLGIEAKLLWVYIITKCDHAGLLKYNKRKVEFETGIEEISSVIEQLGSRIAMVNDQLLYCTKYIMFQYPDFPHSKQYQQKSAIELLEKHGLIEDGKLKYIDSVFEKEPSAEPTKKKNGSHVKAEKSEKFVAPSLEEVMAYFKENSYSEASAIKAFNFYDVANWVDSKGSKVRNWKQKMQSVWFKDENKDKPFKVPNVR